LIETATTLAVIALVSVGLVSISNFLLTKQQVDATTDTLNKIRRGVTGNPVIVVNEARTSFGYLGDMGKLPAMLQDLWVKGTQPAFTFDTAKKAGAGWNGPYLEVSPAELAQALSQDGWGNTFSYTTSSSLDPVFGATVLGKLSSLGPDLTLGNNDDIAIDFFSAEINSRVQGYVKDTNGNIVSGVGLTLNYPQNGALVEQPVYTDETGYYAAADIPFGNRSITIKPILVLAPGTVVVSGANNQHLKFTVKNYGKDDVDVSSLTLRYSISPTSKFEEVNIDGGANEYNNNNPRFGIADPDDPPNGIIGTVAFSAKTAKGTGLNAEALPIRLQSPVTNVADIIIGKVGKGGSLVIEFRDFFNEVDGVDQDVLGVNFEITLRNAGGDVVGVIAVTP